VRFSRLDVRLVKRIDAQDVAGNRCRYFPDEELLGQVVLIVEGDGDDRLPGSDGGDFLVIVLIPGKPQVDDQLVPAVGVGTQRRLADNR
jgi:hypothetical protein